MTDIQELANLTTTINIFGKHKVLDGSVATVLVQANVCIKASDGCFQYANINSEGKTVNEAVSRALRIAKSYEVEARTA